MSQNLRQTPLTCSGHTRPVVFLSFSEFNPEDEANYYSISACKGKFKDNVRKWPKNLDFFPNDLFIAI